MENNPKKSRALIITIILVLLIVLLGYLIFKNKDVFGVKTSNSIAKIFSPLIPSDNSKGLNKISAQAGEDIKKGDNVSVSGTGVNNIPIVMKTTDGDIYGYANQDINNGDIGEIILSDNSNNFWNSFSNFLGDLFNNNITNTENQCANGADNFPSCTTINGECLNGQTNPPLCTDTITECTNGADNFPSCSIINGECLNGGIPPLCTNNGIECTNGATNFPLCNVGPNGCLNGATNPFECTNIPDGPCDNGAFNPPQCDNFTNESPDLTITGNVSPISTTINTPTTLSTIINNIGGSGTENSFSSYFSISNFDKLLVEVPVSTPAIAAGMANTATTSHIFLSLGEYSVRVCADKSNASDMGTITESNEDNNCGPITIINVENSLPPPDTLTQCSDNIDNDGDKRIDEDDPQCYVGGDMKGGDYMPTYNDESSTPAQCSDSVDNDYDDRIDILDPQCHVGGDITQEYLPKHNDEGNASTQCSDNIDNDNDNLTDRLDPQCHLDGNIRNDYIPTHNDEGNSQETSNECLLIDQYPLEFTDSEKSQLDELTRKFYLIAPNLKTEDDIEVVYSDITQYENFSNHLTTLINQCYAEGINRNGVVNRSYQGPTLRFGNPWYKYSTNRGSYIEKIPFKGDFIGIDCKYVSGWFSGRGETTGKDCELYNYNPNDPSSSLYSEISPSCSGPLFYNISATERDFSSSRQEEIYNYAKDTEKCVWNNGVDIEILEKILNVW